MESGRYRFGLFELNATTRELRREGALVRLQAQPTQVLACLVVHAGEVVSREELHRTIWGGDTFVDFDRGLNFCISQIRSALKDDSAQPTYVRTIPKQGYQFIAPVERISEPAPDRQWTVEPLRNVSTRTIVLVCAAGILAVLIWGAGYKLHKRQSAIHPPIIAVLRFDNETGNADMNLFSDGLTDSVVEQLVSASRDRYRVIGNAQILRVPRDQRDLKAVATSLHAAYAVLGQVQSNSGQIRILAHLIRLPEQTHLWVVRTDRTIADPLSVESEVAHKIAAEFSTRVSSDPRTAASLPLASR
jgi:DNA-binding winged helix-turn-helix (wHTH) protein/TolB-like protein